MRQYPKHVSSDSKQYLLNLFFHLGGPEGGRPLPCRLWKRKSGSLKTFPSLRLSVSPPPSSDILSDARLGSPRVTMATRTGAALGRTREGERRGSEGRTSPPAVPRPADETRRESGRGDKSSASTSSLTRMYLSFSVNTVWSFCLFLLSRCSAPLSCPPLLSFPSPKNIFLLPASPSTSLSSPSPPPPG